MQGVHGKKQRLFRFQKESRTFWENFIPFNSGKGTGGAVDTQEEGDDNEELQDI